MRDKTIILYEVKIKETTTEDNFHIKSMDYFYWKKIKSIKEFSELWKKAGERRGTDKIFNYLEALSEAYEFSYFSLDCLTDLLEKKPNNDMLFLISYFYYSLIHNIKKTLDCLALMIKEIYIFKLPDSNCDLFYDVDKKNKFFVFLTKENKSLCDYLRSVAIQNWLKNFTTERKFIAHKSKWPIIPKTTYAENKIVSNEIVTFNSPPFNIDSFNPSSLKDKLENLKKVTEILTFVCQEINKKY